MGKSCVSSWAKRPRFLPERYRLLFFYAEDEEQDWPMLYFPGESKLGVSHTDVTVSRVFVTGKFHW